MTRPPQTLALEHLADERRRYRNSRATYEPPAPPQFDLQHGGVNQIEWSEPYQPRLTSGGVVGVLIVVAWLAGWLVVGWMR